MPPRKQKTKPVINPHNTNMGTPEGVFMLEESIKLVGAGRSGVMANNAEMLAGNHTLQAMQELGIPIREIESDGKEWIVVKRTDIPSADTVKGIQLAVGDNQVSNVNFRPNIKRLLAASEKADIQPFYSSEDLAQMIAKGRKEAAKEEEHPESEAKKPLNYLDLTPRAKVGDVWQCGAQKIICGDSHDAETWHALFGELKAAICVTSPPYAKRRKYDEDSGFTPIEEDDFLDWFYPMQEHLKEFLAPDGSYFLNIKSNIVDGIRSIYDRELQLEHVREWGWLFRDEFCWRHNGTPVRVWNNFKNQWEPVFHFSLIERIKFRPEAVQHPSRQVPSGKSGPAVNYNQGSGIGIGNNNLQEGMAYPGNVIQTAPVRGAMGFPAAYPVELPTFFIKGYTDPSDIVFDPFCGSGTTLIAAQREQRRGLGIDLSPKAVEVTLLRLEKETQSKAFKVQV